MLLILSALLTVLFVIGVIAFIRVIYLIYKYVTNKKERRNTTKSLIISTVIAIIGIYSLVSFFVFSEKATYKQESTFYDLVALEDTLSEDFHYEKHIFSMRIDKGDTPVYRFYYRDSDGDVEYQEKNVKDVSLVYPDSEPGYEIIKHTRVEHYNIWGFISLSSEDDDTSSEYYKNNYIWYEEKLHLPEGSLVTDINIDMQ